MTLLRPELHGQRIRLVGVTASNFRDREQLALFGDDDPRRHQTAEAVDRIRRKYGERAITRATLVQRRARAVRARPDVGGREAAGPRGRGVAARAWRGAGARPSRWPRTDPRTTSNPSTTVTA